MNGRRAAARCRRRLIGSVLKAQADCSKSFRVLATRSQAARIGRALRAYAVLSPRDVTLALRAVRNYRALRDRGITIRKAADIVIGTFCIEHGHRLLHDDRDFVPMEAHLGLRVA